jgi:hypothetical protein
MKPEILNSLLKDSKTNGRSLNPIIDRIINVHDKNK